MKNILKSKIFWTILILLLVFATQRIVVAQDDPIVQYVCTDGEMNYFEYEDKRYGDGYVELQSPLDGAYWWRVEEAPISFYTGHLTPHHNTTVGQEPEWVSPTECNEDEGDNDNPYGYYGVECGGSNAVFPELAGQPFYVYGIEYHINLDGTLSWVVPEDAIWTWHIYDMNNNLIVTFTQTEKGNCTIN